MIPDNRRRAFSEIVTLDAWHKPFSTGRKVTALHVDVGFTEGRIGGESNGSNVRFLLKLKRATVVVIVPPSEPARVKLSSVSRDDPHVSVTSHSTKHVRAKGGFGLDARGIIAPAAAGIAAGASANISAYRDSQINRDLVETTNAMRITHFQTPDGHNSWKIDPSFGAYLLGRPWDAIKKPRLSFEDMRRDRGRGVEPNLRVEVRCKREDLEISEIHLQGTKMFFDSNPVRSDRNRRIAAEAIIRTKLSESGLVHGDFENPYADICISAVVPQAE